MVGAIGAKGLRDIVQFEVSGEHILTFNNFVRNNSVRFTKHNTLLKKPISEYVGPELDQISFTVILKKQFGVDPMAEFNKLIRLQRDGTTVSIMTGTTFHGMHRWVIKDLSMPWGIINNKGECISCNVSIILEEYI